MRRVTTLVLATLAATALVGGCATVDEWQRKTIFSPVKGDQRWHREPLAGTEVFDLPVAEGQSIRAWYTPAERADAPTVLYLHGARWNLNGSVFRIERWVEMGYNVLAIDYRGFGASSELVPSEDSARTDTRVAFEELMRREPDPTRRVVYGHSLGGALALDLAAGNRPDEGIAAVVVESTFTSIPEVAKGLRWGWVPGLDLAITQRFDSLAKVGRVEEPLLILHGTADGVVPHEMADALYAAAAAQPKRVVKLEGASHSGASRHPGYPVAVREFLATLPAPPTQRLAASTGALGATASGAGTTTLP
jgi:alpha-beta hydrolase superfamily lysophospholipase